MNYLKIENCSLNNGDGCRTVLWVSGCERKCKGCHNPETWDKNNGKEFGLDALDKLVDLIRDPYCNGLTILGGEPLTEYNKNKVLEITETIKFFFPEKDIWLWTGYKIDEVIDYITFCDIVIDGEYVEDLKSNNKYFGSSNQRMWKQEEESWRRVI